MKTEKIDLLKKPPKLWTGTIGSFARRTIEKRKSAIIKDLIATGKLTSDAIDNLLTLAEEITNGQFSDPFSQNYGLNLLPAEKISWDNSFRLMVGKSWFELPWYEAEAGFYLKVLAATGYYDSQKCGYCYDPFTPFKDTELSHFTSELVLNLVNSQLSEIIQFSLRGNRLDLSNYEIDRGNVDAILNVRNLDELIINDIDVALHHIKKARRIDIVTDNAGTELLCDFVLIDRLLNSGVRQIRVHVKDAPFFVSDATAMDVHAILGILRKYLIGNRLDQALSNGRLLIESDWFWNGPLHYPDLSSEILAKLGQADLVVFKGDVNYRRLLSDRDWQPETQVEKIVSYFPSPILILRTLKSEIVTGLKPGQAASLSREDPDWLVNGKRGIVQIVLPAFGEQR